MVAHNCTQEGRFDTVELALTEIKDSLKKLTELLVANVRTEEQLKSVSKVVDELKGQVKEQETRLRQAEDTLSTNKWIERFIWLLVTAAIPIILNKM